MRKITFGGAISLDNFLARPDGAVDWLMWSDESAELMKDYFGRIDTILMGRKTWEFAVKNAPPSDVGEMKTYVFSRTLAKETVKGAELVSENAIEFVRDLKQQKGKEICLMGGGDLAKSLFEARLIDEIGFNIHPVLLGAGIPVYYPMNIQIDLELIESRPFKNGCVYVTYRVKN